MGPLTVRLKAEGDALAARGEYEAAAVKYQAAANQEPEDVSIRFALGSALRAQGQPMKGAGILVVEDGDFLIENQLDWDGVIIVTARYVSVAFQSGSRSTIYGVTVVNETVWNESGTNLSLRGRSEVAPPPPLPCYPL
mgnify:CR=1 FL=1